MFVGGAVLHSSGADSVPESEPPWGDPGADGSDAPGLPGSVALLDVVSNSRELPELHATRELVMTVADSTVMPASERMEGVLR